MFGKESESHISPSTEPESRRVESAPEKKETPNVFVEIGVGHFPMTTFGKRTFFGNDRYVGVDLPKREPAARFGMRSESQKIDLSRNMERVERRTQEGENISFAYASGGELPFAERSVAEVYVSNVFGDPSVGAATLGQILSEARRVLKNGGKFTIRETNTPADQMAIAEALRQGGFDVIRIVSIKDKDWDRFSDKYHPAMKELDDDRSYYLVAVKKP